VRVTSQVVGAAEPTLAGLDWNDGTLSAVAPLRPPLVRIDADLGAISPRPGAVDVQPLLQKVATIHDNGGEPLVIIDYLPAWLGQPTVASSCHGCDPTLVAPQNWDAYDKLVRAVVERLATAAKPARQFEVWNEPDLTFWNDTAARFLELAVHTHRDVADVAVKTHLALLVGGPAAAMFSADPIFIKTYVAAIEQADLPINFVSFHWYANYPCLGPDHPENPTNRSLWEKLKCSNPKLTPASYGALIKSVQAAVRAAVPASRPVPEVILDEWNMSAGGFDVRQDSNVGAAFALASLIEMENAGLSRTYFYRAVKGVHATPGDWGIATQTGRHIPAWSILYAWEQLHGSRLMVSGSPPPGVWLRAVRSPGSTDILVANFAAQDATSRQLTLQLDPTCTRTAKVRTIDATHTTFFPASKPSGPDGTASTEIPNGGRLGLALPPESATWITTACPAA
jgi:Glycosyl hydrolases family 39